MKHKYAVGTVIYNQRSGPMMKTPEYVVAEQTISGSSGYEYTLRGYSNKEAVYPRIMEQTIDGYYTTAPYMVKLDDRLFQL